MKRWIGRIVIALLALVVVVVIAGPWALYGYGLTFVEGRPMPPTTVPANAEDIGEMWAALRVTNPVVTPRYSPHSFILEFGFALTDLTKLDRREPIPGIALLERVARAHNIGHMREPRHGWHFAVASMAIWLSRNWTHGELVAKAVELHKEDEARRARRQKPG